MRKASVCFGLIFSIAGLVFSAGSKGYLFIIGGGKRPQFLMKEFISLAAGHNSGKIIIFPMASSVPKEVGVGLEQVQQFLDYGATSVEYHILSHEEAENYQ